MNKLEKNKHDKIYRGEDKTNFNNKLGNVLSLFGEYMKRLEEEEKDHKIYRGEDKTNFNNKLGSSLNLFGDYMKRLEEEEKLKEKNKEYSMNYQKPDISKLVMSTPTPSSPVNINISYNSQNSVNELENEKMTSYKESLRKNNSNNPNNKNLGTITSDVSNTRLHGNSDWVYGDSSWTNNPDYYVPQKSLNEWSNTMEQKTNTVCPLMDNMPWSEYKSGDSEPEPYNV
jgi:hypothetical protein